MVLRISFHQELRSLQDEVLMLGSMVDKSIARSIDALERLDHAEARRIIQDDNQIDAKRFAIEERAVLLIATQQPLATDLRAIISALHIIVDLERMGDHAEGIAKIVLMHGDNPVVKPLLDIPRMADKSRDMLHRSLDAYIRRDPDDARVIAAEDDEVDALYEQVYRELFTYMINDPRTFDRATWLLWVAHNLERIADRVTNICERVVFTVTGRMEEINTSKY